MRPTAWIPGLALLASIASAAEASAQDSARVTINATTGADSRPVSGASIVIDSMRVSQVTDGAGRWSGSVSVGTRRIRVLSIGFRPRDTVVAVGREGATVHVDLPETMVPLGGIVVTAARREQRLAEAVVETELITSRDLAGGSSDLASVLTERVGIQIDGGVPAGAGIQLRGFGSRRVLVLLDGQPLVGRVNGTMDLARLPVSGIERIEIVKGPQSTLYGTDAIGGVINVITKPAPSGDAVAGVTTTTGSQGRTEVSGDAGWRNGRWSTAMDGGYSGVSLVPGVASDVATYSRRAHGGLRGRWDVDSAFRVEYGAFGVLERQRYRTGQLYHFGDNVQSSLRLGAHNEGTLDRWSATVSASLFDHLSRAATRGTPVSDSGSRDHQRLVQAELLWSGVRGPRLWDAGVALRREWIQADRLSDESRAIAGVEPFAQATLSLGSVLVTPGARLSWSDRWGRFVAPRVAAMLRPADNLAFRAALGKGFRAPDFKELYLSFVNDAAGYAVYGNPDLRPERSTSMSLGTEWTGARAFARATAFTADYRDFIETKAPDAAGTYTYGNIDRGWTRGIEMEGGVLVADWRVEAGGERLWTRDQSSGSPLLGRTPYSLRASIAGPVLPSTRATIRMAYAGRTPIARNESSGTVQYRGAFPRLDLRLARQLGNRLELSGEMRNVLDRQLGAEWPGFTGRQALLQLRWRSEALE